MIQIKKKRLSYIFFLIISIVFVISCNDDVPIIDDDDNGNGNEPPPTETSMILPKKEMRSVWITTAWGLDWPMNKFDINPQKDQYIQYLDKFKELNINAVIVQIKPMGDAFYNSPYEPWSSAITGTRGQDPGYDVLQFMIEEAHARDIEFHAWMNPYRIATRANNSTPYPPLHSTVKPEWVMSHEKIQIYNPALPEVRQRLSDIVKDLITKYDVDGLHFDDYFYPDPSSAGTMVSDAEDFQKYGSEYNAIEDFRRGNVDKAIEAVHDVIVANKPEVIFTISPAASHLYNLNTLFADISKWGREGWVDVIMPQLYQEIGNQYNDFQTNLSWWTQFSYEADVMIGHGFYKFGDTSAPSAFQNTLELQRQFDMTKRNQKVMGNAMYSARYVLFNNIGITDRLATIYKNKAVIPFLGREVESLPTKPQNVRIENNELKWNKTGDVRSVVYHTADLKKEAVVVEITEDSSIQISSNGHYAVTTLNKDNKESELSDLVERK